MARTYRDAEIVEAFRAAGVGAGDVVHIHSALFALGAMADVPPAEVPAQVCRAVREVIGPEGTLTVPASFDDYARHGTPYDCVRSPVDRAQGVFSQHVAALPDALRTYCPMGAVAGVGARARSLCHQWTGSCYGTGSAWEGLYHADARMCFLGIRPCHAFTFTAFIQFRFGVPHFYNKIYTVPVFEDGREVPLPIVAAVRYLNPAFQIAEDCEPFERHLQERGLLRTVPLGRGRLYVAPSTRALFEEGTRLLQQNLFYFCKARPQFIPGQVPMDGSTGAFVPDEVRFRFVG